MIRRLGSPTLSLLIVLVGALGCEDDPTPSTPEDVEDMGDVALPEPDATEVDAFIEKDAEAIEPDMAPIEPAELPPVPVAIETRLGSEVTAAGVPNRVTCVVLGADDGPIADIETRIEVRPEEGWERDPEEPGVYTGRRAGGYQVTCTAPDVGLRDATPSRWDVEAGPAVRIRAEVDPPLIDAGGSAEVSCAAVDAEGNPVDASGAVVTIAPQNPGVSVDDRFIDATTSGRYRVACNLGGAAIDGEGRLDVSPGLPSSLVAQLSPDEPVYTVGSVVGFPATVTDLYGNLVEAAPLVWTIEPDMPGFGAGRYLAANEGRYTVGVSVEGPTFDDAPLSASAEFLVDEGGPAIRCDGIADTAIERRGPVQVEGQVADIAGLAGFEVDGQAVELDAEGRFSTAVDPAWGLNVHTLVATDAFGNENSTFCAYFAADDYLEENASLFDGVALHLSQAAVDDGAPNAPITSLADLLRRVLDSQELINTIDATLRAQNPIVPNECRARLPIVGCIARLGAEYRGMEVRGPNELQTTLLNGGIRFRATLRNVRVSIRTTGTISAGGSLTVSDLTVDLTFNVDLDNGRPRVRLRGVNEVRVGALDLDLDGAIGNLFDGAVNLIFGAFDGLVRDELAGALRGFLEGELDQLLSGILDGLDLASLGLGFEVPTFDGSPPINLALGVALDQVNVNAERLRVGISTRVDGDTRQAAPSAGVAMVESPARIQLRPAGSVAGAISLGLINQVLHRLWRAGFFSFPDAASVLGDLPEGTAIGLDVRIPPAVEGIGDNRVRLHLGPAIATVAYPGLFDEPLRIRLAAKVTAGVDLVGGNELNFGGDEGVVIESLDLVIDELALAAGARESIERDLTRIVQAVADQALNDLLPTVPIPEFALPEDLVQYGVPRGTRLGLRNAVLSGNRTHFILDGSFGE